MALDPDDDLYSRSDWSAIGCGARNRVRDLGSGVFMAWRARLASRRLALSIDSMSTRGASGLTLERHWQLMGALESVNGMLLFGVSTAWLFTVAQGHWSMIAARVALEKADARPVVKSHTVEIFHIICEGGSRSHAGREFWPPGVVIGLPSYRIQRL